MRRILLTLIICCSAVLHGCGDGVGKKEKAEKPKIITAAHYFSDAWPKTFWQEFEKSKVASDIQQIKNDGFNTIILVIPWRGFELNFEESRTSSNSFMYERLNFVLSEVTSQKMHYMLRLGFPHNFDPQIDAGILKTCTDIYTKEKTQNQWKQFLNNISESTEEFNHYNVGVLISWEDFWCPHFVFPQLDEIQRLMLAKDMGYQQWLKTKDLTLLKIIFSDNDFKFENVQVPQKDAGDYFFYIEFIDQKLDQSILKPAKEVFKNAAMEIRIDKDPAMSMKGERIWVSHDLYLNEENHRGTYWAPFWGADNVGETLSLEQALFNFEYFLNLVTNNGESINHVIEQFNFTDNTPYFPNNASMAESDVAGFLQASIPLLKKYSEGYGLWAYKDYADNALYNGSFENGLQGWDVEKAVITESDSDKQLQIEADGAVRQTFKPSQRFLMPKSYQQLKLCLDSAAEGEVQVSFNQQLLLQTQLNQGLNCFSLADHEQINQNSLEFEIKAISDLQIDEIKLYGFIQKLGVYDEFGNSGMFLDSIQKMNRELQN